MHVGSLCVLLVVSVVLQVEPGTYSVNRVKVLMWAAIVVALFLIVASRLHYVRTDSIEVWTRMEECTDGMLGCTRSTQR